MKRLSASKSNFKTWLQRRVYSGCWRIVVLVMCVCASCMLLKSQTSLSVLDSRTQFAAFSGLPLAVKYAQVTAIKLVYDLNAHNIHYINSKSYRYHFDFCVQELGEEFDLERFNQYNYSEDRRRKYLLANVNYIKSSDVYVLEIAPEDLMSAEYVALLWTTVAKTSFIGDKLRLFVNNPRLMQQASSFSPSLPLIYPSELYAASTYQAISKYSKCGVLRFVSNLDSLIGKIDPTDIPVLRSTPISLPPVAGLIISEFQTPLSHMTILGQNRKIPVMAYKKAFSDVALLRYQGQKVRLTVDADTFRIELLSKLNPFVRQKKPIALKYNLKVDSVMSIADLGRKAENYAGHKAANFAVLYQLSKKHAFKVPESAFVIPFSFYSRHLHLSSARTLIDSLLVRCSTGMRTDSLIKCLHAIRQAIRREPLDTVLLNTLSRKLRASGPYRRFRFRSSTNAEDAKGFSGAGLYSSKTGTVDDGNRSFEKAIKEVWASAWSYDAFTEREYYHLDQHKVYMAVLVHRSFPDEEINGVAITKNLYRKDNYGFVVNAQRANESVVKPTEGVACDQFICYPDHTDVLYNSKSAVDIIAQSDLNPKGLLMTEAEIRNLANQLECVKRYFNRHYNRTMPYLAFALDVEFKLDHETRTLYFKQVRPYND